MAPRIGYLLPTREQIMDGRPEAAPLLELAERAEGLGYDSVWVGDSLLAKPRHEPLTLLAGVAGRARRVRLGTAVLLPVLRNPVLLAHQVATLDQISEGRLILGVGIAADVQNVRDEFESAGVPFDKRVGRMLEGLRLCRALWSGEPVDWDGRWRVKGGVLGPTPHRPGGPPIWIAGSARASLERAGHHFDGWFPTGPSVARWAEQWAELQDIIQEVDRDPRRADRRGLSDARHRRRRGPGRATAQHLSGALLRRAGAKDAENPGLLCRSRRRRRAMARRLRQGRRHPPRPPLRRRP